MDVRRVLSYVRRACEDYEMIKPGDRIAADGMIAIGSALSQSGKAGVKIVAPAPKEASKPENATSEKSAEAQQ